MKTRVQIIEELRHAHGAKWAKGPRRTELGADKFHEWRMQWWDQLWEWFPSELAAAGCWHDHYRHGNVNPEQS